MSVQKTPIINFAQSAREFKILDGNRQTSRRHIQELIKSFEANPGLVMLRPILVNEHMEVVDGQHRLEALAKLEWGIPYIMQPGLDIETAQIMNAMQKQWTMKDYIASYSAAGNAQYQRFEKLVEEYAPIRPTILLRIITGRSDVGHSVNYEFRGGRFVFPDDDNWQKDLEYLVSFSDVYAYYSTEPFAMALLKVIKLLADNYDNERMLKGFRGLQPQRPATTMENLRMLENCYNYGLRVDSPAVVRFF